MAAPETAGARLAASPPQALGSDQARGPDHRRARRCWRVLITKIPADDIQPKDTHFGTLAFLAAGLAFTLIGFVLSAWRWQRVFAVFDIHVPLRTLLAPLPRRAVRRQRAPVDDRWRRPAGEPGREDHRHRRHRVRVGGHRATEWLRRAPVALASSASRSSRRCSGSTTRGSRSPSPAPPSSASS